MDKIFWQNKKVLVTGNTGFKGVWLTLWLKSLGANVFGYALAPSSTPNLFDLASLNNDINTYLNDVRDFAQLKKTIETEKPEIVFHLAAQALVRYSYQNPVETFATNVMGTVNLLEALRQVGGARVVVNVTSDKCYENREWFWGYRETEPMGGHDPYSSSKACAELVTAAFRQSYFNEQKLFLASARAGNVIGGGDWAIDRLIPDFFRAIMQKETVKIRNPQAIRPWQHVLEPLSGYMTLAEKLWQEGEAFTGAWNFGPDEDDAKSVEWIANQLRDFWDEEIDWQLDQKNHPHEARYLKLDISKARAKLKWQPRWTLQKALSETIEWYKAYLKKMNVKELMLKQIAEYQLT